MNTNLNPILTYLACLISAACLLAWGIATNDPAPSQPVPSMSVTP